MGGFKDLSLPRSEHVSVPLPVFFTVTTCVAQNTDAAIAGACSTANLLTSEK